MPSFTTIFRAGVMLAVGAIVFKGWQLYGPPAEKVKSIAVRAVDMAQAAWKNFQTPDKAADPAAEPPAGAPPFAQDCSRQRLRLRLRHRRCRLRH